MGCAYKCMVLVLVRKPLFHLVINTFPSVGGLTRRDYHMQSDDLCNIGRRLVIQAMDSK